jgi:hypothetical protein
MNSPFHPDTYPDLTPVFLLEPLQEVLVELKLDMKTSPLYANFEMELFKKAPWLENYEPARVQEIVSKAWELLALSKA